MSLNIPNLNTLIAHLEAQPPERINMAFLIVTEHEGCGTCGCILGHADIALGFTGSLHSFGIQLGLSVEDARSLTHPDGWDYEECGVRRYPAHRVIATLKRLRDHYLATGEVKVDWGPEPGAEPAASWSAPQAVETNEAVTSPVAIPTPELFDPPELPAEITDLLRLALAEPTHAVL